MKRFFRNLMARTRKAPRRCPPRPLERPVRPTLERLEERMAPSSLFPTGPCR
jgi:hypothetical protein